MHLCLGGCCAAPARLLLHRRCSRHRAARRPCPHGPARAGSAEPRSRPLPVRGQRFALRRGHRFAPQGGRWHRLARCGASSVWPDQPRDPQPDHRRVHRMAGSPPHLWTVLRQRLIAVIRTRKSTFSLRTMVKQLLIDIADHTAESVAGGRCGYSCLPCGPTPPRPPIVIPPTLPCVILPMPPRVIPPRPPVLCGC